MLQQIRRQILLPQLNKLSKTLTNLSLDYQDIAMVSRTHGQLATPTTLGKEVYNFVARINRQIKQLETQAILAKLNGAVGNYNAHLVAFPAIVWDELALEFIEQILDVEFNPLTTQIEPHDYQAEFYDNLRRINVILIDLARDIWGYISLNYFKQKVIAGEVGSSTMPHKVNPIDFENAEGNFGLAISLLGHLAEKLPISRFQRDLSDSTVQRNIGVAIGYMVLGLSSMQRGILKLEVNLEAINAELDNSWELLTEPIQTLMRKHGISDAYEQLKSLSRGKKINQELLAKFISALSIPAADKQRLMELTPHNYLGLASQLVEKYTNSTSGTKE